jgi:hypothetical protein
MFVWPTRDEAPRAPPSGRRMRRAAIVEISGRASPASSARSRRGGGRSSAATINAPVRPAKSGGIADAPPPRPGAACFDLRSLGNVCDDVCCDGSRRDNRSRRSCPQSAATGIRAQWRLISLNAHEADLDIL